MAGNDRMHDGNGEEPIRCSFCGKTQDQVRKLVKGPDHTYICDECVQACADILEESLSQDFMMQTRYGMPLPPQMQAAAASEQEAEAEPEPVTMKEAAEGLISHVPTPHEI